MSDQTIEFGKHGLYYLTDKDSVGIFIAARSSDQAVVFASQAERCLPRGINGVQGHTVMDHDGGVRVTVPDPAWMTPDQRQETIDRLRAHLAERLLS